MTRPAPALKLTSLKFPESVDWMGRSILQNITKNGAENVLLLMPGQMAEIAVEISNTGDRALPWRLEVKGEFPCEWWQTDSREEWRQEREILPNDQFHGTLLFQVPIDFFERQTALTDDQRCLKLNFQSEICLYLIEADRLQLVGYRLFQFWIRPNCTYLDFLPEIYQATDFMGRFLMLFEQTFDPTVEKMDVFWAYLDPLTAPKALLPFLAQWVAWNLEPRWTLKQQRRLLRNAVRLYYWRGTRWGLLLYLHFYTNLPLQESDVPDNLRISLGLERVDISEAEKRISIVEAHNAGFMLGQVELRQSPMLGGGRPYHFTVTLRPDRADQIDSGLIRNIIEQVKPAFCTYDLWIVDF